MRVVDRFLFHFLLVPLWIFTARCMTLNCDFKYLKDLDDHTKEIYACESINFTNRYQSVPINYVTNLHELGQRDRDVKVFIIKHQSCQFLPMKIENYFPHLEEIEVDSSGLRQLHRENFAQLSKLKMAIFPGNEIEYLPGDLFINNLRLTHIDFSDNRIKTVGRNLFDNLYNLRYLMFDDNECYEGFGIFLDDVETVKSEVLMNCSSMPKHDRRIVMKLDDAKPTDKMKPEPKKDELKKDERPRTETPDPTMTYNETHVTNRCSTKDMMSLGVIAICYHLHVFATLLCGMKIKF